MRNAPIFQITLQRGAHSIVRYRDPRTSIIQDRVIVVPVEDSWHRSEWPRGVYLFTSLDGMSPAQLKAAQWLWNRLTERPDCFAPINDPGRVIGRFQLLKKLHETGVNDFDVHFVNDLPNDVRFPAFVRYENLHRANLTDLLHSQDELDDAVADLLLKGEREEDLIVTEWLDYRDDDGLYRKYGAHIIGSSISGRHVYVGTQWMIKLKYSRPKLVGDQDLAHVRDFLHRDLLAPVFDVAGHGWGRMDYSFHRGRLQVWEVNDNPEIGCKWKRRLGRHESRSLFYKHLVREFDRVAADIEPGPPVEFSLSASDVLGRDSSTVRREHRSWK